MSQKSVARGIILKMEGGIVNVILGAMTLGAAAISVVLGTILAFHWFSFGSNSVVSSIALTLYIGGCSALLIALIALAVAV